MHSVDNGFYALRIHVHLLFGANECHPQSAPTPTLLFSIILLHTTRNVCHYNYNVYSFFFALATCLPQLLVSRWIPNEEGNFVTQTFHFHTVFGRVLRLKSFDILRRFASWISHIFFFPFFLVFVSFCTSSIEQFFHSIQLPSGALFLRYTRGIHTRNNLNEVWCVRYIGKMANEKYPLYFTSFSMLDVANCWWNKK